MGAPIVVNPVDDVAACVVVCGVVGISVIPFRTWALHGIMHKTIAADTTMIASNKADNQIA